jgi:hypothetical protein
MSADPIIYCLENLTDYRQFERLCTDVMNQSGYADIEPLGGSNDRGRDAIHISRNDLDNITIFAYSVRGDWENKLLNEDCKRIHEEGHELNRLVFAFTSAITASQKDAAKRKVFDQFGWTLDLYDLERLRTRLGGDLRHLIAQHSAIFCPPFFPTRGGLSICECRDTLVIDHHRDDHAMATWLARRLQLVGYRIWCYGTAPLAGEAADDSIRVLIEQRALRFLPILSPASIANVDFISRCGVAAGIDGMVLPCYTGETNRAQLPSKVQKLTGIDFSGGWSIGLKAIMESLRVNGITPALSEEQGKAIALRSYVPEPVTKDSPERVYANTFATSVPEAIYVCELTRELSEDDKSELRRTWAFVEANSTKFLAFEHPPDSVPLRSLPQLPGYAWKHYEYMHNRRSVDVVKELIWRSLEVACVAAGLKWCDDRRRFYFEHGEKSHRYIPLTHVDGCRTRVAATGEKTYGIGARAAPFRYQLCPTFRVGCDEAGDWWVTMRIYVRITDTYGLPHQEKAITRRRKNVTKGWWNKEWFARTLAVMQALGAGTSDIRIGSGSRKVTVSTKPLDWDCPVAIDYVAVERIGDFQEEMAGLRYLEDDDDSGEDKDEDSRDE